MSISSKSLSPPSQSSQNEFQQIYTIWNSEKGKKVLLNLASNIEEYQKYIFGQIENLKEKHLQINQDKTFSDATKHLKKRQLEQQTRTDTFPLAKSNFTNLERRFSSLSHLQKRVKDGIKNHLDNLTQLTQTKTPEGQQASYKRELATLHVIEDSFIIYRFSELEKKMSIIKKLFGQFSDLCQEGGLSSQKIDQFKGIISEKVPGGEAIGPIIASALTYTRDWIVSLTGSTQSDSRSPGGIYYEGKESKGH